MNARQKLLAAVIDHAAGHGFAGKSLREIAAGTGTSHRMLLYHFESREGLIAAIVSDMERRQHELLVALAAEARTPRELMAALWTELSEPRMLPFVRLFFEVVGLAAGGRRHLLPDLTDAWLDHAMKAATAVGMEADPALLRAGVAVTRGLLLDLVAGADRRAVDAAHEAFIAALER
ncbi:TetR/AcrR family transcriptional regulator [Glycomyces tenuis]|uniref:TetR/AcrR family transcriptional regulator n=1 Tax=Glycomyces tenuis TaxID=58116 RepID=UPI0004287D56|nr:TetR/AcrR family transcriptional regulator [Glycomyces tenuis]